MFVVALFTRDKPRNQSRSIDKLVKKTHLYTMKFYSTINKNKVMIFIGIWIGLEIINLSKISQTLKDKYYKF